MTSRRRSRPCSASSSIQVPNAAGTQAASSPLPGTRSSPSAVNDATVAACGAGPWPSSTKTSPRPASYPMTGTSPPGPFRCGSTTCSTRPAATAASKAFPPFSSTAIPAADASQWVEATMPNAPASCGRVVKVDPCGIIRTPRAGRPGAGHSHATSAAAIAGSGHPPGHDTVSPMTDDLFPRLRAVCDLDVAGVREGAGRHEYDGLVQDLSPAGVRAGLAALARAAESSDLLDDAHDEAHLAAFEDHARISLGELELHRRNPLIHLTGLDLACYDRDYGPQADRDRARLSHLARWPQAVDAAITSLDLMSAPVAAALLGGIKGLAAGIPPGTPEGIADAARAAHERLVAAVAHAATSGDPDAALGAPALATLMSRPERM